MPQIPTCTANHMYDQMAKRIGCLSACSPPFTPKQRDGLTQKVGRTFQLSKLQPRHGYHASFSLVKYFLISLFLIPREQRSKVVIANEVKQSGLKGHPEQNEGS